MKHVIAPGAGIIMLLIGLAVYTAPETDTPSQNESVSTTETSSPARTSKETNASSNDGARERERSDTAYVSRVIDGDTIELATGETIRYIGIDTPETANPYRTRECFGSKATEANRELVEHKDVVLVRDVSERDKYGRLLRYVYVDNVFVNKWLVRNGYAYATSYPPDVAHQDALREAQRKAREEGAGLWSGCENPDADASVNTKNEDRECNIKGNISYDDDEKIYHVPGCKYYEETVINEDKGERWFCSEDEAREAGWRKAYNCPG